MQFTTSQRRPASRTSRAAQGMRQASSEASPAGTAQPVEGSRPTTSTATAGRPTTSPGGASTGVGPTPAAAPSDNGGATDVGVTGTQINIGTVTTLSGPVPGLFAGAVTGTQAWAAYQNNSPPPGFNCAGSSFYNRP